MGEVTMAFREIRQENSDKDFGTKNALARIVRNRWRSRTIEMARDTWDLSDAEARGVVYAQASQRTIDKILKHRNGGWAIQIAITEAVIGHSLHQFIDHQREAAACARREHEERERALLALSARLPSLPDLGFGQAADPGRWRDGPSRIGADGDRRGASGSDLSEGAD